MHLARCIASALLAAWVCWAAALPAGAQDSPGPAPGGGELRLHLRSVYMNRSFTHSHGNYSLAVGGWLDYATKPWHGFSFGTAVYTSQPLGVGDSSKGGSGLLNSENDGITVLGELWLKGEYQGYSLAVGRQQLDTPMINPDFWAMIPRLFEAAQFKARPLDGLQLTFAHVVGYKAVDDSVFQPMSQAADLPGSDEPVTLGGGVWQAAPDVKLQLWEYYCHQFMNEVYAEAVWSHDLAPGWSLTLSGQALDQRDVGEAIGGHFTAGWLGGKADLGWRNWVFTGAYTAARDGHDVYNPWGGYPGYTNIIEYAFDRADEKTWLVQALYDFKGWGIDGMSAFATYADGDTPDSGPDASPDQKETDFTVDYYPPAVQGLWLRVRFAHVDQDENLGGEDVDDFRIYFNWDLPNIL